MQKLLMPVLSRSVLCSRIGWNVPLKAIVDSVGEHEDDDKDAAPKVNAIESYGCGGADTHSGLTSASMFESSGIDITHTD